MPADTDPFALRPVLYARSERVDDADHLVSGHARIRHAGQGTFLRDYITVTDSTRLNANPDLSRPGLRYFTFDHFKVRPWLRYLHRFHWRYCDLCSCHITSFKFSTFILENIR